MSQDDLEQNHQEWANIPVNKHPPWVVKQNKQSHRDASKTSQTPCKRHTDFKRPHLAAMIVDTPKKPEDFFLVLIRTQHTHAFVLEDPKVTKLQIEITHTHTHTHNERERFCGRMYLLWTFRKLLRKWDLNGNQRQLQLHEECAFEQETTHLPYRQAPVVVYPTTTEIIRLLVSSYQQKNADSSDKIQASKLDAILLFTNQIGHQQIALLVAKMQIRCSKNI